MKSIETLKVTARTLCSVAVVAAATLSFSSCNNKKEDPAISHSFEAVDLGLSVKWATCNIGAKTPQDYGMYFAWAETNGNKDSYTWATYKYIQLPTTLTKYCDNSYLGNTNDKSVLEPEDDAAQTLWKGTWRMPTKEEFQELAVNCKWVSDSSMPGCNIIGPNGNSIFLPAAGYYDAESSDVKDAEQSGKYWTSSLQVTTNRNALALEVEIDGRAIGGISRCYGLPIRPVTE